MKTLLLRPPTPSSPEREIGEYSPEMSFFRAPIHNVWPSKSIDLEALYHIITSGRYAAVTQQLRQLQDPGHQRSFKARCLDYVTISGVFTRRCEEGLVEHSGLLVLDLDHLEDLEAVKQLLLKDTELETELLFTSPSGKGLKWVVACDLKEWSHAQYFQAVANYLKHTYGLEADVSGSDVSRACFIPHDPLAVLGKQLSINNNQLTS